MALRGRFPVALIPQRLMGVFAWEFAKTEAIAASGNKRLQRLVTALPDRDDADSANDIYAGSFEFAGIRMDGSPDSIFERAKSAPAFLKILREFGWLKRFSRNPKHLHACFVARMLTAWRGVSPNCGSFKDELARLELFTHHLPHIANPLDTAGQLPFVLAILLQVKNLKQARTPGADETIIKALAMAHAALVLDDMEGLGAEASLLLETHLPSRILADGGHVTGDQSKLLEIARAIASLEQAQRFRFGPQTRTSIDRLMQFLKMLQSGDGKFAFIADSAENKHAALCFSGEQHLSFAPQSGFARLTQGKSFLIIDRKLSADFSIHGRHLMLFSGFQTGADEVTQHQFRLQVADTGSFFDAPGSPNSRRIFMAASGHDIRIEDQLSESTSAQWLKISLSEVIKATVTRGAATAMLLMPDRTVWQITVRGAKFVVEPEGHDLFLKVGAGPPTTVNWSIKKLAKPATTGKTRDNMPDLPF